MNSDENTKVDDLLKNSIHPLQSISSNHDQQASQPIPIESATTEEIYNQLSDQEMSQYPPTLDSLQKELIEVKRVVTVFGNYMKKVEHVLNFHNEHIKKLVLKDGENVAKQIGAELNPPEPTDKLVFDESKVLKDFVLPIKELTEENMIPKNTSLILLYTHTCPHCITMKPILENITSQLLKNGIQVCAINVARQRKAAIEYKVKGVPAIRLVHETVKHEFNGQRTESTILEWVNSIVSKSV